VTEWDIVEKAFQKNPLPKGASYKIEKVSGTNYVVIEKPYKL